MCVLPLDRAVTSRLVSHMHDAHKLSTRDSFTAKYVCIYVSHHVQCASILAIFVPRAMTRGEVLAGAYVRYARWINNAFDMIVVIVASATRIPAGLSRALRQTRAKRATYQLRYSRVRNARTLEGRRAEKRWPRLRRKRARQNVFAFRNCTFSRRRVTSSSSSSFL